MEGRRPVVKRQTPASANNNCEPVNNKCFTNMDILCIVLSMGSFVVDFSADVMVAAEYWRNEHLVWSLTTFLLVLIPAILIQLFSMRWHLMDEAVSLWHWIAHLCLIGILYRYVLLLRIVFNIRKSKSTTDIQKVYIQHTDICMLHLFESFLEAAPQFLLQSYIMTAMSDWHTLTAVSAIASLCSLYWGLIGYMRALKRARKSIHDKERRGSALSVILQITWRSSMLAARLATLFMFAVAFKHWIFLLLSVHWFMMMIWIIYQKTDFCPSQSEEILYNCVVGIIYCFCFFNLRMGQARYRMVVFYSIMVSQNLLCLLLFLFIAPGSMRKDIAIITSAIILSGTFLGISSMLIYYRWLHPSGPLKWGDQSQVTPQPNPEAAANNTCNIVNVSPSKSSNPRSLKTAWQNTSEIPDNKNLQATTTNENPQLDVECTDKKHLLDHWMAHAGTPTFASVPIDNTESANVTGIEFYSVTNSPEKNILNTSDGATTFHERLNDSTLKRSKRRGICSATELGVKFTNIEHDGVSRDNITESSKDSIMLEMTAQKRRGICSSGQLKEELVNGNNFDDNLNSVSDASEDDEMCNGKTSSESFYLDLDLSFSDINSSDINEFNENIVQKLCLSTLKNIKNVHQDADIRNIQKIALEILKDLYSKGGIKDEQDLESELSSSFGRDLETPSEALSTHDYENICAVNIAREAWGLRSWRACSDMGGSSPLPPPPPLPQRRPLSTSPQQHYINTVAYELAKCEETNCQLMKNAEYHKEDPVFVAKPYVVDPNDSVYPLTTLEPILEELDDVIDNTGSTMRRRQKHGSESALVATIDEIRNDTVTDSPRNVYHRPDWDSPCLNFETDNLYKNTTNFSKPTSLRKSLWNDVTSKLDIDTPQELSVKLAHCTENIKSKDVKKKVTISDNPYIINDIIGEAQSKADCNTAHPKYGGNAGDNGKLTKQYTNKRSCNNPQAHVHKKTTNKYIMSKIQSKQLVPNIIQLQQKRDNVSDGPQPDIISGSLHNLIDKDCQATTNVRATGESRSKQRNNSNRPRRKFSLLREKFEPKAGHSDEEMLFQSLESVRSLLHNDLDTTSSQTCLKKNIILVNQEPKIKCDKENLTPKSKTPSQSNDGIVLSLSPCTLPEDVSAAIKDKPTVFLKQVLGPPKMNNWAKKNISEYVN